MNADERRSGGIYLFDDQASLERYLDEHTARPHRFGIREIRAVAFDVNEALTAVTGGPLVATA